MAKKRKAILHPVPSAVVLPNTVVHQVIKVTSHVQNTAFRASNADYIISRLGLCAFAESCSRPVAGGRNQSDWWRQTDGLLLIDGQGWREYFPVSQLWVTPSVFTLVTLDLIEFPKEFRVVHIYCTDGFISLSSISFVPLEWQSMPGDWRVQATLWKKDSTSYKTISYTDL